MTSAGRFRTTTSASQGGVSPGSINTRGSPSGRDTRNSLQRVCATHTARKTNRNKDSAKTGRRRRIAALSPPSSFPSLLRKGAVESPIWTTFRGYMWPRGAPFLLTLLPNGLLHNGRQRSQKRLNHRCIIIAISENENKVRYQVIHVVQLSPDATCDRKDSPLIK